MTKLGNISIAQYSWRVFKLKNSEKNSIGEEGAEELGEEGEELGEEGEVAVPLSLLVAVPLSLLYWTRLLTLISCKYHLYSRFSFFCIVYNNVCL